MHGQGKIILIESSLEYSGNFEDGMFSGKGKLEKESKNVKLEGNWIGGKPEKVSYEKDGQTYHISFLETYIPELKGFKATVNYPNGSKYHG